MIDTKSKLILSILSKECENGNYKIVEICDIISALPRQFRMDSEAIEHILTYLERQDAISIKYDDDDVYCLAILPYGYQILENSKPKLIYSNSPKTNKFTAILCFFSAFLGTMVGIGITFLIIKLFNIS